jgi:hypothetical protein
MLVAVLAGCGSSSAGPKAPTVQAAHTFGLEDFSPAGSIPKESTLSFVIKQPSGAPLTAFRRGPGPHTGVHLIIVRSDLGVIIHRHPPIGAGGRIEQALAFPTPGRYRLVVDAYPKLPGSYRNFQLFRWITVAGDYKPGALPPSRSSATVDGYRFVLRSRPLLRALQASFLKIDVTDPSGRPARFTPWYGALAHAIFFRAGSLDYFHTHICSPGAAGCTSTLGGTRVTGSSSTPGKLTVGVLVPVPGTWVLFLQCQVNGHVLTAPFTLKVA